MDNKQQDPVVGAVTAILSLVLLGMGIYYLFF